MRALAAESDALQAQARAAWQSLDERSAAAHELEARAPAVCRPALAAQVRPGVSAPTERARAGSWRRRVPYPTQPYPDPNPTLHWRQVRVRQQGEENGRLRATLEEWSHRNARLEARLNRTRARLDAANSMLAHRSAAGATGTPPAEEE